MSHREDRLEGERAVLTCLMFRAIRGAAFCSGEVPLDPDDFLDPVARAIFQAMREIDEAGGAPDPMTISAITKKKGVAAAGLLAELVGETITDANLKIHVENLKASIWAEKEEALRAGAAERLSNGFDQETVAAEIQKESSELATKYGGGSQVGTLADAAEPLYQAALDRKPNPDAQTWGVQFMDELTVAMIPGEYVALAGYPGTGKSAMALQMAMGRASVELKTGIISLEMGARSIAGRAISQMAGVGTKPLMRQPEKLSSGAQHSILSTWPLMQVLGKHVLIEENFLMELPQILGRARAFRAAGARLLIVDYFQLIGGAKGDNRNAQLTEVSRRFKLFAEEKPKTCVVMLSQFSNEAKKKGREAETTDMRDSGSLGQDVDMAILLHLKKRDEASKTNTVRVAIDKGRNVGHGSVMVSFRGETQTFAKQEVEMTPDQNQNRSYYEPQTEE